MASQMALDTVLKRDRWVIVGGLGVVCLLSWWVTLRMAWDTKCFLCLTMPATSIGQTSAAIMLFMMWMVMMVAMMIPTAVPMILTFAAINRRRREQHKPFVPTTIFVLGYLCVWGAFSLIATFFQIEIQSLNLMSCQMKMISPIMGGLILMAAGIFQFTPLKNVCLTHCRTPLDFIMTSWREGKGGAFVMGLYHGSFCLGCCWFLMALLFVFGVMNVFWVILLTLLVLAEKILPQGKRISQAAGIIFMLWGLSVFVEYHGFLSRG